MRAGISKRRAAVGAQNRQRQGCRWRAPMEGFTASFEHPFPPRAGTIRSKNISASSRIFRNHNGQN